MTRRPSPYKGLASFDDSERDALFFFGREREREIIAANLMAARLTVLYGETGVGKSSILHAGVVRHLRELPDLGAVVVFDDWQDDPAASLRRDVAAASGLEPAETLADTLEAVAAVAGGEVLVILDGFEEYFLYHGSEAGTGTFLEDFSEAVSRPGLRAGFLLAIREDALAKIDRFKGRIPNLFGNYLRLDHLDRTAGREAIRGPVDRYNALAGDGKIEIEPALVEAVLDQVAAGKVEIARSGRGAAVESGSRGGIEAPFLQLVMERLWEAEAAAASNVLRLETVERLGGAEQIVRDHLDRALDALDPAQRDVAAAVFNHLVTQSGTKVAHDASDLAGYVGAAPSEVAPVLSALAAERILRPVPGAPGSDQPRYEIYHDILADAVLDWRTRHESEREIADVRTAAAKRHRRLLVIATGAILLVGAMAGLTIFAFAQRSEADAQARRARAQAFDGWALSELTTDPELSLALATEAAKVQRSPRTKDVLRTTLVASRLRWMLRTKEPVAAAHYAPKGTRFLVAAGTQARVFDSRTRRQLLTVDHGAPITAADFSPTGGLIYTAGKDGVLRLWSTSGRNPLRVLRLGPAIRAVNFDPNGDAVAVVGRRVVKVWRVRDGRLVFTRRFGWPVTSAKLSSRGTLLAVVGNHPSALLFSVTRGSLVHTFVQGDFVKDVAFGPRDRLLATGGRKNGVILWNVQTGRRVRALPHKNEVLALAFSPDGNALASASADGDGRIWDVATGRLRVALIGHTHSVDGIGFSASGRYIVTASTDGTARVWGADGLFRALLAGASDAVTQASFSPDGHTVLTANDDGTATDGGSARLWDVQIQPHLHTIATGLGKLHRGSYVGNGLILTAGPGREARLVRASNGRLELRFRVGSEVSAVAATHGGRLVAVAWGRTTTLFDGETGRDLRRIHQSSRVTTVALSARGRLLATGGSDGLGRIWTLDKSGPPQLLSGHSKSVTDIAFSPDGKHVATASKDPTGRIWDVRSGGLLQTLNRDSDIITAVDFSPDGRSLVTASKDADVRLWDVATGKQKQLLRWHIGPVSDASFSSDGQWIVSVGPITIQLWRPGVRDPLFRLGIAGPGGMTSATFDSSSRRVFVVSKDGQILAYRCNLCAGLDDLLRRARAQLAATGRKLTASERKKFSG
jgi:WD40 repeat protein